MADIKKAGPSAAADKWITGNQGKALPIVLFHKINGDGAAAQQHLFVHDIQNTLLCKLVITVLWLIQSQNQGRPGRSATRL